MTEEDIKRIMANEGCSPKDVQDATTVLFCITAGVIIVAGVVIGYWIKGAGLI
jgi:hypothetical protein